MLAESSDHRQRFDAVVRGATDDSRLVRRTAVDAAADLGDEGMRGVFEARLSDSDGWIRWKAVRSLGELGAGISRAALEALADDGDFQVRFEVARVLREDS